MDWIYPQLVSFGGLGEDSEFVSGLVDDEVTSPKIRKRLSSPLSYSSLISIKMIIYIQIKINFYSHFFFK